jgi:hypothetical protein
VDPYDELLEEPLFLDGIAIRRWSDLALVPRPQETAPERALCWADPESDGVAPAT